MVSEVYTLDPTGIKFDTKFVIFNPLHNELEYEATKESIRRLGQLDPILMLDGICIDGRHRVSIAKELGIPVKCIDVDPSLSTEQLIAMCNKNVMSGRDYDSPQKAIQALKLVNEYGLKIVTAAKMMKIDRQLVSYAATIKGYNRNDILETLMESKKNKIQLANMERPSRSLELLAKYVKTLNEETTVIVDDSERIQWSAEAYIKTEQGKAWYYEQLESIDYNKIRLNMLLAEMANMKFKVQE